MKNAFIHTHPFEVFLHPDTEKIIVGTLPPPRFSTKELKPNDVNFCYGSKDNLLWLALNQIYNLNLEFENTQDAITQRKEFLIEHRIGICDIVHSCERIKIDASDIGMQNVVLRNLIGFIEEYKHIHTIIFTGGGSKNGPEYFLKQQLKTHQLKLNLLENEDVRTHTFTLDNREIITYSLISPSNAANRFIGSNKEFKEKRAQNPNYTTFDFRVKQYEKIFKK